MDQKIQSYIESLILEILQLPVIAPLTDQQKSEYAEKVRDYFYNVIFDTTLESMTTEQLQEIKGLAMGSPEMLKKMEEISAQIPLLAVKIEERLNQEVEVIKDNPFAS